MKYLILGDIHGRPFWREMLAKEQPDTVIFLGDFVTTHESYTPEEQLKQLRDILDIRECETIILRGNHDMQGLGYYWAACYPLANGCEEMHYNKPLGQEFLKRSQWCYRIPGTNIICSHAGISEVWLRNIGYKEGSIVDYINSLEPSEKFGFTGDRWDDCGYSDTQPCTWIRPATLQDCSIIGYTQVVGHTGTYGGCRGMTLRDDDYLWCCDAMQQKAYLVIEVDKDININPKQL